MSNGTNPGQQIYQISQESTVTPYPSFTIGYQPTAYQIINSTLQEKLNNSQYTDLRAAYLDPITFPPSTLLTDVTAIQQPTGLDSSQQADWQAVQSQLETELTEISSLYNFWTQIQTNANSISGEFNDRFQTAMNILNNNSTDGTLGWLSIFTTILSLNPDTSGIGTIMGMFFAAASQLNSGDASGDMSQLQQQLSSMLETISTDATNIYEPIAQDWGKLQQFYAAVASASTDLLQSDLTNAGNQYETSIYQSVIPSTMAIVYFHNADWGTCAYNGYGLGYTPNQYGQEGYNAALCSRFSQINVSLSDVINQQNGWTGIAQWECVSTREGTYCHKTG